MNKAGFKELSVSLIDSLSVIKLNAQLAFQVERPKWVDRYLDEITKEVEKSSDLLKKMQDMYESECYSYSGGSGARVSATGSGFGFKSGNFILYTNTKESDEKT
jgi:hypothetical protein